MTEVSLKVPRKNWPNTLVAKFFMDQNNLNNLGRGLPKGYFYWSNLYFQIRQLDFSVKQKKGFLSVAMATIILHVIEIF